MFHHLIIPHLLFTFASFFYLPLSKILQTFPLVYILMSRRTKEAYVSALKYVHDNLIPLVGKGIIIDFEKAMRAALYEVTPDSMHKNILGCWFHMCQAVRRKIASLKELYELIRTEPVAKNIFRRFQCLALLPANEIAAAFITLSQEALKSSVLFSEFIDYFHEEWIKRVKPHNFSVFLRDTRTTAAAEAFNGKSNKIFKTHGNFFHFVETLQKEEVAKAEQLEGDVEGLIQRSNQKKYYKDRSQLIKDYSYRLRDGQISTHLFLKTIANPKNNILFSDAQISVLSAEVDITTSSVLYEGTNLNDTDDPAQIPIEVLEDVEAENGEVGESRRTPKIVEQNKKGTTKKPSRTKSSTQYVPFNFSFHDW